MSRRHRGGGLEVVSVVPLLDRKDHPVLAGFGGTRFQSPDCFAIEEALLVRQVVITRGDHDVSRSHLR